MAERLAGVVKFFNDEKGWGFILGADGESVFVHYRHIVGASGRRTLNPNEKVEYAIGEDSKKRPMAVDVLVAEMIPGGNRD